MYFDVVYSQVNMYSFSATEHWCLRNVVQEHTNRNPPPQKKYFFVSIGNDTTFALSLNLKFFFNYIGQVFVQTQRVMQTLIVSKRIDFYGVGRGNVVLMIETCIDILVLCRLLNSMT